jgi:hypothetical protein
MSGYPIPDAALDDRLGFVGTAGSGKTYNAGSGVERILASGGRVVIPDPLGVWWGLGLKADGHSPATWRQAGKLVIFGGEHGDMPLNENAGALIGETVAGMAESCILDLSSLGTKRAEVHFMLAFLTALYRHASNEPVHLIFDEADMWAPQQERDKGESPKLLGMMETMVRRGRVKGFIPWLISQRPAVLNKNVLSQVDGLVAFKLTASQDRKAIGDWVSGQADQGEWPAISASLPTLPTGTGIVWLPTRNVLATAAFPEKATFDSSRTPSRGERVEKRALKPLDLDKLKGRLASIEEEAKANDPTHLKAEVQRLTRELAKAERAKVATPNPEIVDANAEDIAAAREVGRQQGFQEGLGAAAQAISALGGKPVTRSTSSASRGPMPTVDRIPEAAIMVKEGLSKAQQRVLNAVAWWGAFGIDKPKRGQVAFIAGYSPTSGGFYNLLGGLRTMALLGYPSGGLVSLSEAGQERADAPTVAPTRDAFHSHVRSKLSGSQLRVFDPILAAYPAEIASDAVAEQAGYSASSGGFFNLRGSLRSLGLVDYPSPGQVRAADWLFP